MSGLEEGWDERCEAQLKSIHSWRCSRRATGATGLCSQHYYYGCVIPDHWTHEINEYGVDVPIPHPPRVRYPGRRRGGDRREASS